jgi:hypothetical protein
MNTCMKVKYANHESSIAAEGWIQMVQSKNIQNMKLKTPYRYQNIQERGCFNLCDSFVPEAHKPQCCFG